MTHTLFDPIQFGPNTAHNRLVMAPLTRLRAEMDGTPNELMLEYYRQRATMGMIVAEGTWPTIEGRTWYGQPGIETQDNQEGWAAITDAVHAAGGVIALQVMHGGRISHPEVTGTGRIVGPSAVAAPGQVRVKAGKVDYLVPHALTEAEIPQVIDQFVKAARRAIDAGFDAAQLHAANSYFLRQFFSPVSNQRTDAYGGTPEKNARMAIEVTQAVAAEIGAERTAIRVSPQNPIPGIEEPDQAFTREAYLAYADALSNLPLHHFDVLHAEPKSDLVQELRRAVGAPFIANSGFGVPTTLEEAKELVEGGWADAVGVGRAVLSNPDLVRRWREGLPLNDFDPDTFYTRGAKGYTDYPFYGE